ARVRNHRTAYALRDADGGMVAEFVDDRVRARDERSGTESSWREWEVELGPAGPEDAAQRAAFFAAVDAAVFAAGGRPASSGSKLARALGH
ncbi:MAG: adenylate cyclase, partial [Actinobacteria bacterium]|nr:adenylate cyclase [Actinomycetota bacterium]